jgi:hypothetical protein
MEIKDFKDDLFDAVWRHSKKLFWPSFMLAILAGIVMMAVMIPVIYALFPASLFNKLATMQDDPMIFSQPQEMIDFATELFSGMLWNIVVFSLIAILLVVLIGSWICRVGFGISKMRLEGDNNWMGAIGKSFDHTLVKTVKGYLFITVFYYLLVIGVYLFLGLLVTAGINLGLILLLYLMLIFMVLVLVSRYIIVLPGIVIGNMEVRESIRFSLTHMTMGRALKLVGSMFAAIIGILIVTVIISLLMNLILGKEGIANAGFSLVLNIFLMTFFIAFALAASAGLFYRYGNFEGAEEATSPEDHLLTEE